MTERCDYYGKKTERSRTETACLAPAVNVIHCTITHRADKPSDVHACRQHTAILADQIELAGNRVLSTEPIR